VKAPFIDPEVAGNAIYIVREPKLRCVFVAECRSQLRSSPVELGDALDVSRIASAIRQSIERGREPEFVASYMSVASYLMNEAANADRSMFFAPERQTLSVNSQLMCVPLLLLLEDEHADQVSGRLDWSKIDFGYPPARFHTSGVNEQYLRVFRANTQHARNGYDVEISLGVPSGRKQYILEVMQGEMHCVRAM
jgi:hypothetical protein